MMKKYAQPQVEIKEFEVIDIITASDGLFSGLADLDSSKGVEWDDKILDPKNNF